MVNILFEDKDIVICEKLPGQTSQETEKENSLPNILKKQLNSDIFVLHRLDDPTGGAIIYAKNKNAASVFSKMITENGLKKEYLTVLDGIPENNCGELCDLLFRDKRQNKSYVVKRERKGVKKAILTYNTVYKTDKNSLVRVFLVTGRTHQIRAQFASRKTPVTGDGKYGSRDNHCMTALWSHSITFIHPFTDEKISVRSDPPFDKYPWNIFGQNNI